MSKPMALRHNARCDRPEEARTAITPEAPSRAGLEAIAVSLSRGHVEEARRALEQLQPCAASGAQRAAELALRGGVAYHCRHISLARGYLSEAERALDAPFVDLVCAARIARYRGLVEAETGDMPRARAWLQRAAELIHSALTSAHVSAVDSTSSRALAARCEAAAIGQARLKIQDEAP
jgi:hypothetical protein